MPEQPKINLRERFLRLFFTRKLTPDEERVNKNRLNERKQALKDTYSELAKAFQELSKENASRLFCIMSGMARKALDPNDQAAIENLAYWKEVYNNTQQNISKIVRRMKRISKIMDKDDRLPIELNKIIRDALTRNMNTLKEINDGNSRYQIRIPLNNKKMLAECKEFFGKDYPQLEKLLELGEIAETLNIPAELKDLDLVTEIDPVENVEVLNAASKIMDERIMHREHEMLRNEPLDNRREVL